MNDFILPLPAPILDRPFQPGVTDPIWPEQPPASVDPGTYCKDYGGQLARQRHLHVVTADIAARSRAELREVFSGLSYFARHQMTRKPSQGDRRPYDPKAGDDRVTVTIGYGATLFTTAEGDDRFELAAVRPSWLKVMPTMPGDVAAFSPRAYVTDMIILLASDDFYVNEYLSGLLCYSRVHPAIKMRKIERGYARPDGREPGGFEDGSSNPRGGGSNSPMERFVYTRPGDDEPDWCIGGTYLAYRKIQRNLKRFFLLTREEQEQIVGADKNTGEPIAVMPANCHKFKMNPERDEPDLLGIRDDERLIVRRPYFYNDGLDAEGQELRGLHHLSFARNLSLQYEWRIRMWAMNPSFQRPGAGSDAIYDPLGGASNVGGGYYFMPGTTQSSVFNPLDA